MRCVTAFFDLSPTNSSRALTPALRPLEILAETQLPTRYGTLRCLVFCLADEPLREHVAMLAGDVRGGDVLTRVHSECLTSEVFGSLRCDCREQLQLALEGIAAEGRGVLVYRRRALGGPDEAHRYDLAASLLKALGVASVRLLGNGAAATRELEALGVRVQGHVPLTPRTRAESTLSASRRLYAGNTSPNPTRIQS